MNDLAPLPPFPPPPPIMSVPAVASASRVVFSGRRSDFRRLVMRGALLELITVGFYRFWLATDIRRHLWSHTSVAGDAPEYTGTAKELLIGFLFAMAILLPIYLVYFLIGIEAENLQAFASTPLFLFFYLFYQFAIYRARRYRLTRTIWRGVRFGMGGSGWSYAWRAGLWTLFAMLTLGIALPWRQAALERFKMRHTGYGDLAGRFDATGWQLFKRIGWIWFLAAVLLLSVLAMTLAQAPDDASIGFAVLPFVFMIGLPFVYAIYKAIEWRWWVSGVRLGDVRFESALALGALIGLYWKVIGWAMLLAILLGLWGGVAFGIPLSMSGIDWSGGEAAGEAMRILQQPALMIAAGIGYVVIALAFVVVMRIYLVRDVWQRVADATSIHNLAAAESVAAQGKMADALGEGFADSLDVAGF